MVFTPEEWEQAVVFVVGVELSKWPEDVELVVIVALPLLVLGIDRPYGPVVATPGDERPCERSDRLAIVCGRPEIDSVFNGASEFYFVACIEWRGRKLLH